MDYKSMTNEQLGLEIKRLYSFLQANARIVPFLTGAFRDEVVDKHSQLELARAEVKRRKEQKDVTT